MAPGWQVGVDVGGTFTDLVAFNPETRALQTVKVESDADDPLTSLIDALAAVGLSWEDVDDVIHGTTLMTNAIVQGRLSPVALVTTEGFADTLEIGRQNRRHLYRLDLPPKAAPLVPAERRFEIRERVDAHGTVLIEQTDEAVEEVALKVASSGVAAVAVCLLHAYANATHEARLGERLRRIVPNVALSHRVNPEEREFERMSTTVLSAGVMPLVAGYLDRLEEKIPSLSRLHLFHSAGGMASLAAIKELPLGLAVSGPAAGVAAAGRLAQDLGIDRVLSFDMGGTTTDVCLIVDGRADVRSERTIAGRPMRQPMVAVETIGAGAGSIARLDTGVLRVGPESAGAKPGPACYGRGGSHATVCDANLALGYIDADRRLGNTVRLHADAATDALAALATETGVGVVDLGLGIVRVANAAMARALRRVTVERGVDGRHCALVAFGGAGPMHAAELARHFGIRRVIVPRFSSVFSAVGCVGAEMRYSRQQTVRMASGAWDAGRLASVRAELLRDLAAPLKAAGHEDADIVVDDVAAVRYSGQSYSIEVAAPELDDAEDLGRDFRRLHEAQYGFATEEPWELTGLRLTVSVPRRNGLGGIKGQPSRPAAPVKTVSCWFDSREPVPTPRFDRDVLGVDQEITGPAIVEDAWSTVVVPPRATLTSDAWGHLHIEVGPAP